MAKKFNLSRELARPKNPENIIRTMNIMKKINEAAAPEIADELVEELWPTKEYGDRFMKNLPDDIDGKDLVRVIPEKPALPKP